MRTNAKHKAPVKRAPSMDKLQSRVKELESQLEACLHLTQPQPKPQPLKAGSLTATEKAKIRAFVTLVLSRWELIERHRMGGEDHFNFYYRCRKLMSDVRAISPKVSAVRFFYQSLYKKSVALEIKVKAKGQPVATIAQGKGPVRKDPSYVYHHKLIHYTGLQSEALVLKAHIECGLSLHDRSAAKLSTI